MFLFSEGVGSFLNLIEPWIRKISVMMQKMSFTWTADLLRSKGLFYPTFNRKIPPEASQTFLTFSEFFFLDSYFEGNVNSDWETVICRDRNLFRNSRNCWTSWSYLCTQSSKLSRKEHTNFLTCIFFLPNFCLWLVHLIKDVKSTAMNRLSNNSPFSPWSPPNNSVVTILYIPRYRERQ